MESNTTFIESINEILQENKLNVKNFADKIDCDQAAVRRWLYKTYLPDPETVIKIAEVFNVSPNYLFGFSDKKELNKSRQSNTFYERYESLKTINGLTDYRVSKSCEIQDSAISKWKSVRKFPAIESMLKLCKTYDFSLDYLLGISSY